MRRLLRDLGLWTLYHPYRWLLLSLPVRWAQLLAEAAGSLHAVVRGRRGRLARNLETVLGSGADVAGICRGYLRAKHRTLAEHFLLAARRERATRRLQGEWRGREHLDAARREGRGAVLVLFHYGNFRMLSVIGHAGYPLAQFLSRTAAHAARRHADWVARRVRDIKVAMDDAMPARFLHWDPDSPSSLREAYRILRRGELLVVHADGSRGSTFVEVGFFGAALALPTGPARMARKTGALLLPVFCVARPDGRHDVVVEDPVPPELSDEEAMGRCAALLEKHVREHPEQWWTWDRLETEELPDGRLRFGAPGAQTARELFVGRAVS